MRNTIDFEKTYDRYFSEVYKYVHYRVRYEEAAEDITGRIFEAALSGSGTYNAAQGPVNIWLFGVARNAVNDWFRARSRSKEILLENIEQEADKKPRMETILEEKEEAARLLKAVEALDERSRDILALKFSSGMTNREIARISEISESNIGTIIYRAVKQLQAILIPEIGEKI